MNDESDMPLVRRLGNWGFARLLGFISGRPLTDCASGMRVIRRGSLKYLMPLPDGLHFTPAMSCNALLDQRHIALIVQASPENNIRVLLEKPFYQWNPGLRLKRAVRRTANAFGVRHGYLADLQPPVQ